MKIRLSNCEDFVIFLWTNTLFVFIRQVPFSAMYVIYPFFNKSRPRGYLSLPDLSVRNGKRFLYLIDKTDHGKYIRLSQSSFLTSNKIIRRACGEFGQAHLWRSQDGLYKSCGQLEAQRRVVHSSALYTGLRAFRVWTAKTLKTLSSEVSDASSIRSPHIEESLECRWWYWPPGIL